MLPFRDGLRGPIAGRRGASSFSTFRGDLDLECPELVTLALRSTTRDFSLCDLVLDRDDE